jgi:hypothetical protein
MIRRSIIEVLMLSRLFLSLFLLPVLAWPAASDDIPGGKKLGVADCTWQPFKIFTNGQVKAPSPAAKDEPLHLRKQPSYDAVLPGTGPFDWPNAACNLWPGMQLRIADWGGPKDRFAKVYYDGLVFWVSKTYRDGSPALLPIAPRISAEKEERAHRRE